MSDSLLMEMPEANSISICLDVEAEDLFEYGEKLNEQVEEAYMNGYNWEAVIRCYMEKKDPELNRKIQTDPEAGMYVAYMTHNPQNLEKMKRFETYLHEMLADKQALTNFIIKHRDEIEWD